MALSTRFAIVASIVYSCVLADQGLHLKSCSEDEVNGCYEFNQTLAVCFDVQKNSIVIKKTTGERLVQYHNLGREMFFYQVLDQSFIGRGPSLFYVPDVVPREPAALRAFAMDLDEDEENVKNHFQAAMRELHYVPEIQLLERVSAALAHNSTRLKILQPFHALCLNLMIQAKIKIPSELAAERDMEDETADRYSREKRCTRPNDPKTRCLGLCGLGCTCWWWVCGDCCRHQGCYEHDLCCLYSRFSVYCLFPYLYGFSCSGYDAYRKSKCSSMGWRRK